MKTGTHTFAPLLGLLACGTPAPDAQSHDEPRVAEHRAAQTAEPVPRARPFRVLDGQVLTDTFDVRHDLRDGRLTLALHTDLGDAAKLMVSVSRIYQKRGSDERYPVNYFSQASTVGAWREPRTISLDQDVWDREVEFRQRALAAGGEPFTVSRIADDIEIGFVVPVNQEAPFEPLNANLRGAVVTRSGRFRIVEREIRVRYPIGATNVGRTRFADPLNLATQTTYRASGEVPLVPDIDPPDPLAAAAAIRRLRPGDEFTVLEKTQRRGTPWYRVQSRFGESWLNSTALIGQDIVGVR